MASLFGAAPCFNDIAFAAVAPLGGAPASVDFVRDVQPIFAKHCYACHGESKQKSGLRLDIKSLALKGGDQHAPDIVPGRSGSSAVIRLVSGKDEKLVMPLKGERLSPAEVATLTAWIDEGAVWPDGVDKAVVQDRRDHWAYKPVANPAPPATKDKAWPRNDLDRFVLNRLEHEGLTPAKEADRAVWLRRVYLDLTGLPPTPSQVDAFIKDDNADAYEHVVDELLNSPRYGERWAQHWLDVVRYADTHGFEVNTPREHAWPYRDYVIRAFNEDKPYDRFILEQLAGDALQTDEATGFLVASAVLLPGQIGKDDASIRLARQDALDEIIVGTSGTFLGMTIGCARCHDHKFDPIKQRDYYAFQAFFAGVEYGDRPINDAAHQERLSQAAELGARIERLQSELRRFEPLAFQGRTLLIDEEDTQKVTFLKKANGPGANPAGTQRGYRDDVGDVDRLGNLSGGRYTWWNNVPGEDVLTYNPQVAGRFRLWLSWGVHGSGVHTRDARYMLDHDGDPATRDDQRELASVDQYYPAGVDKGETEKTPQWSGLLDVGVVDLAASSKIILRGGATGTGITADVIVLQEALENEAAPANAPILPKLREPVSPLRNVERFAPANAKFVRFTTHETINDNRHEPCIDELEVFAADEPAKNVALAANGGKATSSGDYVDPGRHELAHINDGQYGNERSWISKQYKGGWVQIEFAKETKIDHVVWGRDRDGKYRDRLPTRYQIDVSRDGVSWQTVATHADRLAIGTPYDRNYLLLRNRPDDKANLSALVAEMARRQAQKAELEKPELAFAGTFRTPDVTHVLRRGDPEQPTDKIGPAIPELFQTSAIANDSATLSEQERRLALARWIASPDNPLTARVMVNRIWQHHFGVGLVATPDDFGLNGMAPSHPELLDWLAHEFVTHHWSIKHLQRLIVLSATYRQSSVINVAAAAVDRDNRLLWRFPSRRMEAEAIRDSMLAVSGELNLTMGGPGFNFFKSRGGLDGFPPVEKFGPEGLRRMIYAHKVRMEQVPVFGAFDCPDAGQMAPKRSESTTAIQALNLFNSEFVAERAEVFAARIMTTAPDKLDDQVTMAFMWALGRKPAPTEQAAAFQVVREHGLAPLCRVLFNSSEFLFIP